ncbi:MAG: hypothetical protein NXI04_22815 [Planctomycetaceae bacterium]|nr:hypothetical protein [Planctomycetaceae bacterium]
MSLNTNPITVALIVVGIVLCLTGGLADVPAASVWLIVGCAATAGSLLVPPRSAAVSAAQPTPADLLADERRDFEQWQQEQLQLLATEADRLRDRNVDLAQRSARFQEFLEYPLEDDVPTMTDTSALSRLTEQDRQVHELLEEEAKRVYEAIRNNDYIADGNVDVDHIRNDALEMVRKVARIYAPDSKNPLLETSFEQLARAASRTCLHTLVLLEQLPLDVKTYSINELYTYLRRAVTAYGTYKQAAPWLKRLSRTAYAGRLVASSNPVTLGAWWLATEVTRRGAGRLIENAVDRQAIAVLHDIVTVLGTEVASVYGPGFRQRDPAWIYGTELTEMLHAFPMSRESLSQGLQEITRLELRSEYDRIYLYRCLAQGRPAGNRLADPALLTRSERENIAQRLESFFQKNLHGITEDDRQSWQEGAEQRLDLKMQLTDQPHNATHAVDALQSVAAFLTRVTNVAPAAAARLLEQGQLLLQLPVEHRTQLLERLASGEAIAEHFEPPDIDPAAALTGHYLNDLFHTAVASGQCSGQIESLLVETGGYFRRPQEESQSQLDACFAQHLQQQCSEDVKCERLAPEVVRVILQSLTEQDHIVSVFDDVAASDGSDSQELRGGVACVLADRVLVFDANTPDSPVWRSAADTRVKRIRGYVIDDCELTGGRWEDARTASVRLAGSLTSGGFQRRFGPLLERFAVVEDA